MAKRQRSQQLIMGKNCLQEVLDHQPERLLKVYTSKNKPDPLIQAVQEKQVPVQVLSKTALSDLVGSESHQSYAAQVQKKDEGDLRSLLRATAKKEKSLVLILDSISDPQNLGALLRAAECFGVDAVIWSKNRGTDVTPVVTKASVGASELVKTLKVSNLSETIKQFQESDYWVVTAEVDTGSESLYDFTFPEKTVLVMGSEGKGIQPLISKRSDHKVHIPMLGKINSLNVSQATSVFLSYWHS